MELDQVTAFLEVARHQSFSRAAEKLYRTQPAISAQIRALEEEFGQKLFDRGTDLLPASLLNFPFPILNSPFLLPTTHLYSAGFLRCQSVADS